MFFNFHYYKIWNQKSSGKRGRPRLIHYVSGCEVEVGGPGRGGSRGAREGNMYKLSSRVTLLLVKTSSIDHANITSPELL